MPKMGLGIHPCTTVQLEDIMVLFCTKKYGRILMKYSVPETLNYLVDKGADPNVQNFAGDTPLHNAVSRNHRESIQVCFVPFTVSWTLS